MKAIKDDWKQNLRLLFAVVLTSFSLWNVFITFVVTFTPAGRLLADLYGFQFEFALKAWEAACR